jgi:hypothetical protein
MFMEKEAPQSSECVNLPIDDGRGPDEEWPWQRADNYGTGLGGTPNVAIITPIFFTVFVIGFPLLGFARALLVSASISVLAALLTAARFTAYPRQGWRLTNPAAAEYRVHRALLLVDPELAKETRMPSESPLREEGKDASRLSRDPRARTTGSIIPRRPDDFGLTTGPTVPWDDDDLPF